MRYTFYTRASGDNKVENEYNSLEKRKESLMAYIRAYEYGSGELINIYEDAGYLGGDLNPPEQKRLLNEIRRKIIDALLI